MFYGTLAEEGPPVAARWFHATDVPKGNHAVYQKAAAVPPKPKQPQKWKPFSARCSAAIEAAFQKWHRWNRAREARQDRMLLGLVHQPEPERLVSVGEDHLYDVDVVSRELRPVYWPGEVFEVRRGTWFRSADGSVFVPCEESLTQQLEIGFRKFQPWQTVTGDAAGPAAGEEAAPPEKRWALLGPWMGEFVVYAGAAQAWMLSDQLTSKLARAVMTRWSHGENLGGTRLVRGWSEVRRLAAQVKGGTAAAAASGTAASARPGRPAGEASGKSTSEPEPVAPAESLASIATADEASRDGDAADLSDGDEEDAGDAGPDRPIEHLLLVIHGIGQRWGTRMEAIGLIHDCHALRESLKHCAKQFFPGGSAQPRAEAAPAESGDLGGTEGPVSPLPPPPTTLNAGDAHHLVPRGSGIQVLPVQWRHRVGFDVRMRPSDAVPDGSGAPAVTISEDREETTLEDVTLDGVPMIRNVISDVALDVLLYMTPEHRQSMIVAVTSELNRVYRLFRKRNPQFCGKVSLYAHSLGSLLAFDVLCNQTNAVRATELERAFSHLMVPGTLLGESEAPAAINEPAATGSADVFTSASSLSGNPTSGNLAAAIESSVDLGEVHGGDLGQTRSWGHAFGLATSVFKRSSNAGSGRKRGASGQRSLGGQPTSDATGGGAVVYGRLDFAVDTLWEVGSPLGLFLLLQNQKLRSRSSFHEDNAELDQQLGVRRPACRALYNLFHPNDPIAYRIEPHVHPAFAKSKPLVISYTKGGLTNALLVISDYSTEISTKGRNMIESVFGTFAVSAASVRGMMGSWGIGGGSAAAPPSGREAAADGDALGGELGGDDGAESDGGGEAFPDSLSRSPGSGAAGLASGTPSRAASPAPNDAGRRAASRTRDSNGAGGAASAAGSRSNSPTRSRSRARGRRVAECARELKLLNPRGRLDFAIRGGMLENPLYSALGSHMSYWKDADVNVFLLREMFCLDRSSDTR